jgi:hypothetical protein
MPPPVWGSHVGRGLVTAALLAHLAVLVWLCASLDRVRMLAYDVQEVSSEAVVNLAPGDLESLGYREDDPSELSRYRDLAAPVVASKSSDQERIRALGDWIYALRRPGAADVAGRDPRLSATLAALQRGEAGSCGDMSLVLAAMWRGLGGHSRAVLWTTADGAIRHQAVELFSTTLRRWIYYDVNLNGYGADENGTPLSIAALRSLLLTGEHIQLVANARAHDWTPRQLIEFIRASPLEWYALNNRLLYFEADRRFGVLNRRWRWMVQAPMPLARALDNLVGERDRRLVVRGRIAIAGVFTLRGAHFLLGYLMAAIVCCAVTLRPRRHLPAPAIASR